MWPHFMTFLGGGAEIHSDSTAPVFLPKPTAQLTNFLPGESPQDCVPATNRILHANSDELLRELQHKIAKR